MTTEELYIECHRLFYYEDGHLKRKIKVHKYPVGYIAGCKQRSRKHMIVRIKGKNYYIHRLIYLMHFKHIPEFLDHIDGNGYNNKIENLRPATRRQNAKNQGVAKNNKTGFKGVCLKDGRITASICSDGEKYQLGAFNTTLEAAKAYDKKAIELHGEFAKTNKSMGLY